MIKLNIPKMHCGGCANSVTKAIHSVDPGAVVETDTENAVASVNSNASADKLVAALDAAGYPASAV